MKSHFNKGYAALVLIIIIAIISIAGIIVHQSKPVTPEQNFSATFQPAGGSIYRLQNSITNTQTTINLTSFKEPVSDIKYTMTVLGSTIGYGTIEPKNAQRSEFVSFTGITQNTDGTATLTGVIRGLPRSNTVATNCTASSTLAITHGGQSDFILSNSPCEQSEYALKNYDDTITGMWTVPTPLSGSNPATKDYVDLHVNGGTVSNAQVVVAGTAGETITAGQILYLKQSDGRWYKAAISTAEASSSPVAIAQGSGTSGNPVTGGVLLDGLDTHQSGISIGSNYFIGPTAGTISVATSTRILGRAKTNTDFYFHPDYFMPNLAYTVFTMNASTTFNSLVNFFGATTTFGNTLAATSSVKVVATSSLQVGAFPVYNIGKNVFATTTSGTFQVPLGISKVAVFLCAGGASGTSGGSTVVGAAGGAGACAFKFYDVTGVATVSYTIGAGGLGVAQGSGGGNDGGTSSFGTFSCTGGSHPSAAGSGVDGGAGSATCTNADVVYPGNKGSPSFGGSTSFSAGGSFPGGFSAGGTYGAGGEGTLGTGTGSNGHAGFLYATW